MPTLPDISTEQDIHLLVDSFYEKIRADALLGPIFDDVARVDWAAHLPIMYRFWSSQLLDTHEYRGTPFAKHAPLPIGGVHFEQWVALFVNNVDEHFVGPVAEEAKQKAASIASIFNGKMSYLGLGTYAEQAAG